MVAAVRCLACVLITLTACSAPAEVPGGGLPDGAVDGHGEVPIDGPGDVPLMGFGELSGMCGVLNAPELTGAAPVLVRDALAFARAYVDPDDRPLLTTGGRRLAETPNAGGSSVLSEVFAYEQLARCELAPLLKTELEISYDAPGKITDLLVEIDGYKIGVSVTRAVAFPFGQPYTLEMARPLLERKLGDIQLSSANVSAADRWDKQILAYLAYDDQAADAVAQAWAETDAAVKADTIVLVTVTAGDDLFIYAN